MAKLIFGVTGSVAAIRTAALYAALTEAGHDVRVVATRAATYFFDRQTLPKERLFTDDDEWPGLENGGYRRDDPVLHIELRRWADVLFIAPLDANTLAKLAHGLADNCLTCIWRAWDVNKLVILAPAMNTLMWQHPATRRHFRQRIEDFDGAPLANTLELESMLTWMNETCARLRVVAPQVKRLACGDVGIGAMAEVRDLVKIVCSLISERLAPQLAL
jgi:phosphopantothenoylcysteine decarboxylase